MQHARAGLVLGRASSSPTSGENVASALLDSERHEVRNAPLADEHNRVPRLVARADEERPAFSQKEQFASRLFEVGSVCST
jgi:hypothetical protein